MYMRILWITSLAILIPGLIFAQQSEPHALGLSRPSIAEMAESARTMPLTRKVLPNKLAIERLNAERLLKGQSAVYKIPPALHGEEVVTSLSSTAIGSASDANLGSAALASLPGRVDNSALAAFPPIRSQGDIGSCASFSSTYYVGTHMLALARGTNTKNSADNFSKLSPKFTYALVNRGENEGSSIVGNLQTLVNFGAPAWSSFAYVGEASNSANYLEWPRSASVWREATLNRFKETGVVENIDTAPGLENAKALLANGYLLLFGTDIYGWDMTTFSNDPATTADNDLLGKQVCRAVVNNPSGHAMTVVGYDDNVWTDINRNGVVDTGEKGALKIANSWGTNWGDSGFVWFAYAALKNSSANYAAFRYNGVYWITARTNYTPSLLAEFTLSHAQRNQLTLRLGRAGTSSIAPQEYSSSSSFLGLGGAWAFDGSTNAVDGTFVFDFTDLVRSGANRYFLSTTDSATSGAAQVKSFRLTSPSGVILAEATMNVPANVNGATVHSYVDFGGSTPAPVINSSLSAAGRVAQSFSYTISASNAPTSYSASGLPAGLTLQSASIAGTPTQAGTFSVQISASNSAGTGSAALQIQISQALVAAPVITSATTTSAQVGGNFSYTIVATNSPTSYGASSLPNGLSLNTTSGVISGKPTQAGIYALTLEATNAGGTGTRMLVISVESAVLPVPEITSQMVAQGVSGAAFSYRIEATNSPTTFGAADLPSGLTLNSSTGVISGMLPSARVYEVTLTASNASGTVSKNLTLTVTGSSLEGPTNDDFSNRIPLVGANVTATGSNQRSTIQQNEPSLLGQSSHSVWWTWTAPRSGSVTISLVGSSFDTVLGVYTGTTINPLTEAATNDDSEAANTSKVTFNATAGTAYQICVDGYGDAQGNIQMSILQAGASAPQNDHFANRQSIVGETASATGSNFDASAEAGEPTQYGQTARKSVWWTWTAPANGRVTINTVGSVFDTLLAVYTGQSLDTLASVASDDQSGSNNTSQVVFQAVTGTTYQIVVDGSGGAGGAISLNISLDKNIAPANDNFASRIDLGSATSVTTNATSAAATSEVSEPQHARYLAARSIWWKWTAPSTGLVSISTVGSGFDTLLGVYRGSSLFNLLSVASNDDAGGGNTSRVEFEAQAGVTYQIAVDGFDGAGGAVSLIIALSGAPSNDAFANRATLSGNYSNVSGANSQATAEAGEPAHAGSLASKSIWWTWTPSYSATVTISTTGSRFDTILSVYTGYSVSSLVPVVSNDDLGSDYTSSVRFQATAGVPYQIAVDGYDGATGQVELTLDQSAEGGIYETDFEMFPFGSNTLDGIDGWGDTDPNSGTSGIFEPEAGNQAAWIGYNPTSKSIVSLYRTVNVPFSTGVVEFSVDMRILDSTSERYYQRDDFSFVLFNTAVDYLGEILFDNNTQKIWRGDAGVKYDTGHSFVRGAHYTLSVSMDLVKNQWSAYLGEQLLFKDATLNSTGRALNLASVVVIWRPHLQGFSGDNFMIFDNYRLSTAKQKPVIVSASVAQAKVGEPFTYTITATNAPHLSFRATGLPAGLNVDSSTGLISGNASASGTKPVMLTATNTQGSGSKLLLLSVESSTQAAPIITSSASVSGKAGDNFTYQILATNTPTSYAAQNLPTGLSMDASSGLITGSVATAGNYSATIQAGNSGGNGTQALSITINGVTPTPVITSSSSASGTMGVNFTYTINSLNSPASFSANGLPAGLKFNKKTGIISGKPTKAGVFTVNLFAKNNFGDGTLTLTLTVAPPPPKVAIPSKSPIAKVEQFFSYQIVASNSPTSFNADGLPNGLDVNTSNGLITGTPTAAGNFNVTILASNGSGTGTAVLKLKVNPPPPVISLGDDLTAAPIGSPFSYQIMASNSPTRYGAKGLPTGLKINTKTGLISGKPNKAGVFTVQITAKNASGTGSAFLTLTVQ